MQPSPYSDALPTQDSQTESTRRLVADLQQRIAALEQQLAAERERADANWQSLDRIKGKLSDKHNELKAEVARRETAEAHVAKLAKPEMGKWSKSPVFISLLQRAEAAEALVADVRAEIPTLKAKVAETDKRISEQTAYIEGIEKELRAVLKLMEFDEAKTIDWNNLCFFVYAIKQEWLRVRFGAWGPYERLKVTEALVAEVRMRIESIVKAWDTYADSNVDCPKAVKDWMAAGRCALRAIAEFVRKQNA